MLARFATFDWTHLLASLCVAGPLGCSKKTAPSPPANETSPPQQVGKRILAKTPEERAVVDTPKPKSPPIPAGVPDREPDMLALSDLDGDGEEERVVLWCNPDEDQEEDAYLWIGIGDDYRNLAPSLSDFMDCNVEVVGPQKGESFLWVTAGEHEEAGPSLYYLFRYHEGMAQLLWNESAELSWSEDAPEWEVTKSDCDESRHIETTTTTSYVWTASGIRSSHSESKTKVEPGDCETFTP